MKKNTFSNINAMILVEDFEGISKTLHYNINIMHAINSVLKHRIEYKTMHLFILNSDYCCTIGSQTTKNDLIKNIVEYLNV